MSEKIVIKGEKNETISYNELCGSCENEDTCLITKNLRGFISAWQTGDCPNITPKI